MSRYVLGVCGCVRVCSGVCRYAWVCMAMHWGVREEFSEYLLETRVPTSADFNMYPIWIFIFRPLSIYMWYDYSMDMRYSKDKMLWFVMIEIDIIEHCAANDAGIQGYYQQKVLRRHLRRRHHLSWTVTSQPHSMLCTVKDVALGTLFMGNLTLAPSIFMYAHTWPWGPVFGWGRGGLRCGAANFFLYCTNSIFGSASQVVLSSPIYEKY